MENKYTLAIENPPISDPSLEEVKKEEKKPAAAAAKNAPIEVEEPVAL